jgi:hypothetical protein
VAVGTFNYRNLAVLYQLKFGLGLGRIDELAYARITAVFDRSTDRPEETWQWKKKETAEWSPQWNNQPGKENETSC